MSGYVATSITPLYVVTGVQTLTTQVALSYLPNERITLTYALDASIFMQGTIVAYNAVTGAMVVNVDMLSGIFGLQPVFNTQVWGETNVLFTPWNLSLLGFAAASTAAVVPTIIVRALNSSYDPQRGQGLQNFLTDINAVSQILMTRLNFLQGEWFENTLDGTPLFQSLLGHSITLPAVGLILRERILGTPYVTGINSFSITNVGRTYTFTASVQTQFSSVPITTTVQV